MSSADTPLKILVAEDEQHIAKLYGFVLEDKGHKVTLAFDGEEALNAYLRELKKVGGNTPPFDVVMLDHMMPKKNGLEVAKEIFARVPGQRIIFASAFAKDVVANAVKQLIHAVELMQKPFEVETLVSAIESKSLLQKAAGA